MNNSRVFISLFLILGVCAIVFGLPSDYKPRKDSSITTKDTCVLPMERGYCRASISRWGYDSQKKTCVKFYYGGCYGNSNNFRTKEECIKSCGGI